MVAPKKKKLSDFDQLLSDIHSHHINRHTREIYLHGAISGTCTDEEPGVEYRMATAFVKNIHLLEHQNRQNILVHIHSTGGEWGDGMAIFQSCRFAKSSVTMLAYAQATSMSGVILQAADKRVLMPDCDFMVHHGSLEICDNSMVAKSVVDWNERIVKRMLQIFAGRAIVGPYFKEREYSVSKIRSWLDRKIRQHSDWYVSAEEAVYYGLADGILGEKGFETIERVRTGRKWKNE